MGSNLGELLLREKLLNTEQLQTAIDYQRKNEVAMGTAIVSLGLLSEEDMAQALSRLADLQVSRGGNIVLIQNESEYEVTTMPDRLNYLEFVNQLFRRSGFDIPILSSNCQTDPIVPETIDCVNGGDDLVQQLKRMRLRQPSAPLVLTECRVGQGECWGGEHDHTDARTAARRALEELRHLK